MPHFQYYMRFMIFSQNLISILLSKPDKQADMQMSFFGADPLPKTPEHQKKFVAHQNSNFFILSYALLIIPVFSHTFDTVSPNSIHEFAELCQSVH